MNDKALKLLVMAESIYVDDLGESDLETLEEVKSQVWGLIEDLRECLGIEAKAGHD